MTCPREIADVIAEILQAGILRIRALAWSEKLDRCALEADHIHNLPDLLKDFSEDKLKYYWEIERTLFIAKSAPDELGMFEPLWRQLASVSAGRGNDFKSDLAPSGMLHDEVLPA